MLRVVLDANVFVSAYINPEGTPGRIIQSFLREGSFELVLSEAIVAEVLEALAYPKVQKAARSKIAPALWFEDLVVLSHLVAGAVEGRATLVVTGDPDLLDVREYEGVRITTPRALLELISGQ